VLVAHALCAHNERPYYSETEKQMNQRESEGDGADGAGVAENAEGADAACPCGTGLSYQICCGPYHQGKPAPTPEALMRSRYSAFCLGKMDYVLETWALPGRPAALTADVGIDWKGLQVLSASSDGDLGKVSFSATFAENGQWCQLREQSRFIKTGDRWFYQDGKAEWKRLQVGRNDPCPCGSGQKFKKCCDA
jgi:SEC-C motif-containing protein